MDKTGKQTLEVMRKASWYNQWLFELMGPHLKGEMLEIGSGIGNFTQMLLQKGKVTATDISSDYLQKLKKLKNKTLSVGRGDVEKGEFFFQNKKFDTIVSLNVVEHIKNDKKAFRNIYKLLKIGGKFIVLVPAHQILYSKFDKELGHFRRYTKKGLSRKLLNAGFKIHEIRYLNWWAAIGWFFFIKVLNTTQMPGSPVGIFDKLGKIFLWPEKYITAPFGLSVYAVAKK